eukprot:4600715-Amphidinium_carterae.1
MAVKPHNVIGPTDAPASSKHQDYRNQCIVEKFCSCGWFLRCCAFPTTDANMAEPETEMMGSRTQARCI